MTAPPTRSAPAARHGPSGPGRRAGPGRGKALPWRIRPSPSPRPGLTSVPLVRMLAAGQYIACMACIASVYSLSGPRINSRRRLGRAPHDAAPPIFLTRIRRRPGPSREFSSLFSESSPGRQRPCRPSRPRSRAAIHRPAGPGRAGQGRAGRAGVRRMTRADGRVVCPEPVNGRRSSGRAGSLLDSVPFRVSFPGLLSRRLFRVLFRVTCSHSSPPPPSPSRSPRSRYSSAPGAACPSAASPACVCARAARPPPSGPSRSGRRRRRVSHRRVA